MVDNGVPSSVGKIQNSDHGIGESDCINIVRTTNGFGGFFSCKLGSYISGSGNGNSFKIKLLVLSLLRKRTQQFLMIWPLQSWRQCW